MGKYSQDDARAAIVTLKDYIEGLAAGEKGGAALIALFLFHIAMLAAEHQARDEQRAMLRATRRRRDWQAQHDLR